MSYCIAGETRHVMVLGDRAAERLAKALVEHGVTFACDPLPGERWEFMVEHKTPLDTIVRDTLSGPSIR